MSIRIIELGVVPFHEADVSSPDLTEVEPLLCRIVALLEQLFGPGHSRVADVLSDLAKSLEATNRLQEAELLWRHVLSIAEQNCEKDPLALAVALTSLGRILQTTNQTEEAEGSLRRALAVCEQSLRPEHPDVALCLNNLAQLLQATKREAEGKPLYERAVTILNALSCEGWLHEDFRDVRLNYASLLRQMGVGVERIWDELERIAPEAYRSEEPE